MTGFTHSHWTILFSSHWPQNSRSPASSQSPPLSVWFWPRTFASGSLQQEWVEQFIFLLLRTIYWTSFTAVAKIAINGQLI